MTKDNPPGGQRFEFCEEGEMAQDGNTDGLLKWQWAIKKKIIAKKFWGSGIWT